MSAASQDNATRAGGMMRTIKRLMTRYGEAGSP